MVLAANDALTLSNDAINRNAATDFQTEVSLAEAKIRAAAGLGLFSVAFNATVIGNPAVDPRTTVDLPNNQLAFYNSFVAAGYLVGLDDSTGEWAFAWTATGSENAVSIYTFRTIFNPAAVVTQTIDAISSYFATLRPVVHVVTRYNGFIDEAGFGGTTSQFFEFTIIADQEVDQTNHSGNIKTVLVNQGLGYTINNAAVYQLVS